MKFSLSGIEDALRNLAGIDDNLNDGNLRGDALEALQPVVDDAQSLAPVEDGDLRDSIGPKVLSVGTVAVVIEDWKGHFFEFGTVKMRAQPMLIPAWEANEDEVIASFGRSAGDRITGKRTGTTIRFEGL